MKPSKAAEILKGIEEFDGNLPEDGLLVEEAWGMAIAALEKQEQSCDTCRHGRFGDEACINCRVGFPNHYEAEEDND